MGRKKVKDLERLSLPPARLVSTVGEKEYQIGFFKEYHEGSYLWYKAAKPAEYDGHIHKDIWDAFGEGFSSGFCIIRGGIATVSIRPPGPYITSGGIIQPSITYQIYDWRRGRYDHEEKVIV